MDIEVDVSQIVQMAQRYANGQRIVTDELTKAIVRGQTLVYNDAVRAVPVDRGRLKGSIKMPRPTRVGDAIVGQVGSNLSYAKIVEEGRTPGKMPPAGPIAAWMARKNIPAERLYIVRRAINSRKNPRPYLVPAFERNKPRMREFITQGAMNAMRRIGGGR